MKIFNVITCLSQLEVNNSDIQYFEKKYFQYKEIEILPYDLDFYGNLYLEIVEELSYLYDEEEEDEYKGCHEKNPLILKEINLMLGKCNFKELKDFDDLWFFMADFFAVVYNAFCQFEKQLENIRDFFEAVDDDNKNILKQFKLGYKK